MAQAEEGKFESVGDTQLVINLAQIIFHDLFGRAYAYRNLFVLHSLRDAGDD